MLKIDSIEQVEKLLETGKPFFILKHSLTCPISQAAFEEFGKFAKSHSNLPCNYLVVQEARPLSNFISEKFNIKHESPQALLFMDNKVSWHTSHWRITEKALSKAYEGIN